MAQLLFFRNGVSATVRRQHVRTIAVRLSSLFAIIAIGGALPGCATGGGATAAPNTQPGGGGTSASAPAPQVQWPVKRAEHVDLWLHSFAEISTDTAAIPLFKRGYRDSI
ncbi:MAG: hypothetical protein ABI120_10795, partial [Gemmatimonadaceae bacterium]